MFICKVNQTGEIMSVNNSTRLPLTSFQDTVPQNVSLILMVFLRSLICNIKFVLSWSLNGMKNMESMNKQQVIRVELQFPCIRMMDFQESEPNSFFIHWWMQYSSTCQRCSFIYNIAHHLHRTPQNGGMCPKCYKFSPLFQEEKKLN